MKKVLLGICITGLSTAATAQTIDPYKIWNDKEPNPENYKPRHYTWNTTTTTTTTTTNNNYPARTVYAERPAPPPANNTPVVKCTKHGKTTYSNIEPCQ